MENYRKRERGKNTHINKPHAHTHITSKLLSVGVKKFCREERVIYTHTNSHTHTHTIRESFGTGVGVRGEIKAFLSC